MVFGMVLRRRWSLELRMPSGKGGKAGLGAQLESSCWLQGDKGGKGGNPNMGGAFSRFSMGFKC